MAVYTSQMVQRARDLYEAGWTPPRICGLLDGEFGCRPHPTTVRLWVDPVYARDFAEKNRARTRARWQRENPSRPVRVSRERATERMHALFAGGAFPFGRLGL